MTTTPTKYDPAHYLRILTLHQPFASAMAWGEKRVETRSTKWHCLEWVAINAAACRPKMPHEDSPLAATLYVEMTRRKLSTGDLPTGAILAVVRVVERLPTEAARVGTKERLWGDYSPGRFAYFTADLWVLPTPIPWKGAQGVQIAPPALREQIAAALQ